jgi:hypothetical protein
MARLKQRGHETGLRAHLLAGAEEFREMYGHYRLEYWAELSKAVDQLFAGKPYGLHRFELPDDHPVAAGRVGDPCDNLVLTEDDVLVDYETPRADRPHHTEKTTGDALRGKTRPR